MPSTTKFSLDIMGGDTPPSSKVFGALRFLRKYPQHYIYLIGDEKEILPILKNKKQSSIKNIHIIHTREYITMNDQPKVALREKNKSSMAIGLTLVKKKEADIFISSGNTGAQLLLSHSILKPLSGISRPSIGAFIPTQNGKTFLIDVGTNISPRPLHLEQNAVMANIFVQIIKRTQKKPKIALLNIGKEEYKGNSLVSNTYQILKKNKLINFVGNVEGDDLIAGEIDIVICDGFTGNIILKMYESIVPFLKNKINNEASKSKKAKLLYLSIQSFLKRIYFQHDYQNYGGVPLLGINGLSIICHGKSTPKAIDSALNQALFIHQEKINEKLEKALASF